MTARYLIGDVLEVLPTLEENSVDLILTSPPFLALRSYLPADHPDKHLEGGSQPTPGAFIDWLVDVVEALDRVLAPHGSMVIELGDTYAGSGGAGGDYDPGGFRDGQPGFRGSGRTPSDYEIDTNEKYERIRGDGFKQGVQNLNEKKQGGGRGWPADKSLTLIPELFRMTLVYGFNPLTGRQTKRWRLRNVIRWVRPNPPVGALGDKFRPATSELMVFCRTDEAGRRRFFDLDAVREPLRFPEATPKVGKNSVAREGQGGDWSNGPEKVIIQNPAGAPPLDWWNIPLLDGEDAPVPPKAKPRNRQAEPAMSRGGNWNTFPNYESTHPMGAPPLDWWEIPPGGYSGSHYAVFPEALCVRPIKAMCPERVCRTCGEPSRRIAEYSYDPNDPSAWGGRADWSGPRPSAVDQADNKGAVQVADGKINPSLFKHGRAGKQVNTVGWSDCSHNNYRPGLVLDPFAGSGTTLAVAVGHGRDAIGIDLDERNARLAEERIGFFLEVVQ